MDGKKRKQKQKQKKKTSKAMLVVVVAVTVCELRGPIDCARGEVEEGRRGEGVARACSIANSNLAGSSSNSSRQVDQL